MSSKKEEERNEKIIRGLLKLPPNRRCINCNSLGPQYVCTNFWTFVCITCSGIHREFTHRVKSVSMAKFTSQEVEALQKGGNQRAREIFLKDWDLQQQRLPGSSNIDKVREFIKNVYVDRKYAGGKTSDKPPRDMQGLSNHEEGDTRRASSYHSYSQSPPYEYQYEERRYGRQAGALTRKPGSDRALYEGKFSSFSYSPGRYEDGFANERSGSRVSDYSVSSGGDPFRSHTQSPNFQDIGLSSPPVQPVRSILVEDAQCETTSSCSETIARREADGIPRSQRTASSGSFGSFDSNSMSLKSVNSASLFDVKSEPEQLVGGQQDKLRYFPSSPRGPSVSANVTSSVDPFNASFVQQPATSSAPPVELFPSLETSQTPSVDFFQQASSAPSINLFGPNQTYSAPSLDLFANIIHQQSTTTVVEQKHSELFVAENEGWATFDSPQEVPFNSGTNKVGLATTPLACGLPVGSFDSFASTNTSMKLDSVPSSAAHGSVLPATSQWHGVLQDVQASTGPTSTESWSAFEDSGQTLPLASFENLSPSTEPKIQASTGLVSTQSWSAFEDFAGSISQTSFENPPQRNEPHAKSSSGPTSTQASWNVFDDSTVSLSGASFENLLQRNEPQLSHKPPATTDLCLRSEVQEDSSKDGFQRTIVGERAPIPSVPVNGAVAVSSFAPSVLPLVGGLPLHDADRKSTNPFDLPYDSDLEPNSMFLDMSSLQAALPNPQVPPAFLGSLTHPWFPQNPVSPYIPAAAQGGLAYMAGQVPGSQLPNIPSQGPVASLGGNPFA